MVIALESGDGESWEWSHGRDPGGLTMMTPMIMVDDDDDEKEMIAR